ncbi:MAG: hypothetical protein B7Z52_07270, partial [Burkholderiales bacterium 12-64-5]
ADLSNAAFPFGTARTIELGMALVRAHRITYVGELGWELYMPTEFARQIFDLLVDAGEAYGLRLAGVHAMNSLRLEKAYRDFGHDISDEDHVLEAGRVVLEGTHDELNSNDRIRQAYLGM